MMWFSIKNPIYPIGKLDTRRRLYGKVIEQIEKWTYFGRDIYLLKMMMIFYFSPLCISYFNYFVLKEGEASFVLIFPAT